MLLQSPTIDGETLWKAEIQAAEFQVARQSMTSQTDTPILFLETIPAESARNRIRLQNYSAC